MCWLGKCTPHFHVQDQYEKLRYTQQVTLSLEQEKYVIWHFYLQFGIFAAGLENLLGEEVEPGQEDVEATAGISLDLIDVSLRPISFFQGQSGLMGAVWSAPSEPTSALTVSTSTEQYKYQNI